MSSEAQVAMFQPAPVKVRLPDIVPAPPITSYTMLFRPDCRLPQALEVMHERGGRTVVSAPCSAGPEVDSFLALHNKSGFAGSLAITGFDIVPESIRQARGATYFLERDDCEDRMPALEGMLKSYGFRTDFKTAHSVRDEAHETLMRDLYPDGDQIESRGGEFYQISSAPVREGHEVEFIEHDLREPLPMAEGTADLVLANNLFYHLNLEDASKVLHNLAVVLSERGVLSIEDHGEPKSVMMYPKGFGADPVLHKDWIKMAANTLSSEFGLQTIGTDKFGIPVMFGRN